MRLLFVADGRSPIALNWIRHFVEQGDEVHLASTFPCEARLDFASLNIVPVGLSELKRSRPLVAKNASQRLMWGGGTTRARTAFRRWVGPLTLPAGAKSLRRLIEEIQPDLIHAMRIPFEGMLAALTLEKDDNLRSPLLISVWGNDLTLHAPTTPLMRYFTRRTLRRVNALHTDCRRDLRLAHAWGFPRDRSAIVLPGGGGVQREIFYPPSKSELKAREEVPTVINPRGFRAYVRNDTFFKAIPMVLRSYPRVRFVCTAMDGEALAEKWVDQLGVRSSVTLTPEQTHAQMAHLFRKSLISVSPSEHDGTPNTLLEAMACGCFPIAGDIESLREWIQPGRNGLLVSSSDSQALADAIIKGLEARELRRSAAQHNLKLIAEKAEYLQVMAKARRFYRASIEKGGIR